jgi:hypothetical protein
MDFSVLGQGLVTIFCKNRNDHSGLMKGEGEIKSATVQLIKYSAILSSLVVKCNGNSKECT